MFTMIHPSGFAWPRRSSSPEAPWESPGAPALGASATPRARLIYCRAQRVDDDDDDDDDDDHSDYHGGDGDGDVWGNMGLNNDSNILWAI